MSDFCPIRNIDHLELYVGNAKQAAAYYASAFGFTQKAYRGLETGYRDTASYLMEQGDIRLMLTTALSGGHPIAKHVRKHGDGVAKIALSVPDARAAFYETVRRGAKSAMEPTEERNEHGLFVHASIHAYGDTIIQFIERDDYAGLFAPGFQPREGHGGRTTGAGLAAIDHVVGNVELGGMDRWVQFFAETMGFSQLVHFDDKAISTEYSALMSKVMQDGTGRIKFPINEPAEGRRKSQVQDTSTTTAVRASSTWRLRPTTSSRPCPICARVAWSSCAFRRRITTIWASASARSNERVEDLAALGIMADRDDEGYLLQIFTEAVEDRPTLFFEIIERHGAKGFGEGNFKSLFEAIEREQARRGNLV